MTQDAVPERDHNLIDLLVLLSAVALALATWAILADAAGVPAWRSCMSVAIAVVMALASLTRNPGWATAFRATMGGWLCAAPYVVSFDAVAPALWTYLAIGTLVIMAAISGFAARPRGRAHLPV